jgi:4-oxalocrotonate tautomerase
MPHIVVKLYPGRSEKEKAELAQELTVAMISVLGSRRDAISVGIEEVAPDD